MRLVQLKLAPAQPADLAVVFVRAERRVDPAQPVEHRVDHSVLDVVVAQVEDDRHAHHLLDAAATTRGCGFDYHFFSARIAAWSDCAKASLVYVAPETTSIRALCARSASCTSVGIAFWLMKTERSVSFGYTGTEIDVILRLTLFRVPTVVVVLRTTIVTRKRP